MKLRFRPATWILVAAAIVILGLLLGWWKLGLGGGDGGAADRGDRGRDGASKATAPITPTPCQLHLDSTGLTLDGRLIDPSTAVTLCRPRAPKAEVHVMGDTPHGRVQDLKQAFDAAEMFLLVNDRPSPPRSPRNPQSPQSPQGHSLPLKPN